MIATPILLIAAGVIPNPFGEEMLPVQQQYSFDLQIEGYLTDMYDETPTTSDLEGLSIKVYNVDGSDGSGRLYKETVTTTASAGGRFRTSQTYRSGWWVLFVVNGGANYGNASVIVQLPYYDTEYPPSYHYLSSILEDGTIRLKRTPTLLPRAYKPTGATMTINTDISSADWDISSDGSLVTFTFEVYNTVEETGLTKWYDYEEGYERTLVFVLYIPKYRTGTTAAVGQDGVIITSSSIPLHEAKEPTSSQDGVYVCEVPIDAVDIDKNQQTGQYNVKNSFEIDVTFDFSSCGASANFTICWTIWKDTNLNNWQQTGLDTSGDTEMYTHTDYLLAIAA